MGSVRYLQALAAARAEREAPEALDPDEVTALVERARTDVLDRLVAMLNAAIEDERYHVTAAYLLNESNSYSYEFRLFVGEYSRILSGDEDFFVNLVEAYETQWPKPRVVILSFPHNPTTACVDLPWMQRLVDWAREHEVTLVHDFAYSDTSFDGYLPPSILQVPGAKDTAVELYTLTKSFSMAGWRVGFLVGNAEIVQALTKLKSYLDYGTFQPIQIAAIVAMNEAPDYPKYVNEIYQSRRDALCEGLDRIGWHIEKPKGTMFVWAPIPEPYAELGSLEFAKLLVAEGKVATSPGMGFGPGGDGFVRFALIENEQRINQAVRTVKRALTKL